ncbi:acyl carrier protein [Roseovarius tolerans]|uniref:Acyl carrier protein n=1 Tax=Roseovarius tolerans TaxID=74031 RepID=A0A1H8JA21_9RHOB|nr:acyl carrier protein [Roseovarius tolerans]SEN77622.1 acyl carrier protein [Roseovarius tolerans]
MQTNEIDVRVREILRLALKTDVPEEGSYAREDDPNWDSLKHVEMIFMLEDEFDVQFAEDDFAKMGSVAAIVALVEANHAA